MGTEDRDKHRDERDCGQHPKCQPPGRRQRSRVDQYVDQPEDRGDHRSELVSCSSMA